MRSVKSNINPFIPTICILLITVFSSQYALAITYTLQNDTDTVIGEIKTVRAEFSDTLLDLARVNGFGYHDVKLLNPDIDTWIPGEGEEIMLPTQFVLPDVHRQGIVLNIPEMRLYYFPESKKGESRQVITYPLGIGREGWATPYIKTKIIAKQKYPNWYPPESIRKEHEEAGDPLPKVVKAGPENPLGNYAMRLGIPQYLIHGTNKPYGVGMRVSHGCIRLYPEDIEALFQEVKVGTSVNIINQPYKIGERNGVIYLEVHPYLEEESTHFSNSMTQIIKRLIRMTQEKQYAIEWDLIKRIIDESKGIPVAIGMLTPPVLQASVRNEKEQSATIPSESGTKGVNLQLDTHIQQLPGGS